MDDSSAQQCTRSGNDPPATSDDDNGTTHIQHGRSHCPSNVQTRTYSHTVRISISAKPPKKQQQTKLIKQRRGRADSKASCLQSLCVCVCVTLLTFGDRCSAAAHATGVLHTAPPFTVYSATVANDRQRHYPQSSPACRSWTNVNEQTAREFSRYICIDTIRRVYSYQPIGLYIHFHRWFSYFYLYLKLK